MKTNEERIKWLEVENFLTKFSLTMCLIAFVILGLWLKSLSEKVSKLEAAAVQSAKVILLLFAFSLTSCSGLYGPNPQPPGIKGASDVQPTYH